MLQSTTHFFLYEQFYKNNEAQIFAQKLKKS